MSDTVHKRLELLEMVLGVEPSDQMGCPKTPESECAEDCQPDHCPMINNLLHATASQTDLLGHRVRRLEIWLECLSGPDLREIAGLLEQREEIVADISDVESAISQARGQEVSEDLVLFLARQKARLEKIDAHIQRLRNE